MNPPEIWHKYNKSKSQHNYVYIFWDIYCESHEWIKIYTLLNFFHKNDDIWVKGLHIYE